jgi:8-oxo-dGTP pyrophosphatase MutT (NUDIX family)
MSENSASMTQPHITDHTDGQSGGQTDRPQLRDWTGAIVERLPGKIQVGASAVVFDASGKLLLQLRSDNHHWAMPGGRLDPGEDIRTCAVREVFEETGLQVRVLRVVGLYSDPYQFMIARYPDGTTTQMFNVCFECAIIGGELTLSDESLEIGFFDLNALPEPLLLTHKPRIADALARNTEPFVR